MFGLCCLRSEQQSQTRKSSAAQPHNHVARLRAQNPLLNLLFSFVFYTLDMNTILRNEKKFQPRGKNIALRESSTAGEDIEVDTFATDWHIVKIRR